MSTDTPSLAESTAISVATFLDAQVIDLPATEQPDARLSAACSLIAVTLNQILKVSFVLDADMSYDERVAAAVGTIQAVATQVGEKRLAEPAMETNCSRMRH